MELGKVLLRASSGFLVSTSLVRFLLLSGPGLPLLEACPGLGLPTEDLSTAGEDVDDSTEAFGWLASLVDLTGSFVLLAASSFFWALDFASSDRRSSTSDS